MQKVRRLIELFTPETYTLSLTLNRAKRTFHGIVTVKGNAHQADTIMFHAKDLVVESALIDGKTTSFTTQGDELHITHPHISAKNHIVTIAFRGTITDGMHGLYPCYFDHDGTKKELLATQFESHHAREVFPCIDEPEAKATFDLTLTTEQDITVLSNMPQKLQREENNQLVTVFETTPRMSTYLLAWVVGELHKKTATSKNGIQVNVWATPAQSPQSLDFALEIAVKAIDFFDNYFDTPYPLSKCDHVALPDFAAGAMENWGLITYRERALLADPESVSIATKRRIALVICHEVSHQWFGNLVTMKWWDNLWLNESFANLMEYIALDALFPEWNIWLDFSSSEVVSALRRDSIDGVQPVQTDVRHPDEINSLFDPAIVYAKGSRLLRMLQNYIGEDAFQAGLKNYFATYAYQNTESDDLWQVLAKSSGKDVKTFMNAWITQPGYPVVHVREKDGIHLQQEQFFIGKHGTTRRVWPIPLGASVNDFPALLDISESTTQQPLTLLRLNSDDAAHFLTHYDNSLLEKLITALPSLPALNRLQLLTEQSLLARNSTVPTVSLLSLLNAYNNEQDEAVWNGIAQSISELKKFTLPDSPSEKGLHSFVHALATSQYRRLGWEPLKNETETDSKLRALILGLLLYAEHDHAVTKAQTLFETQPLMHLNADLRSLIISAVVRFSADRSVFHSLLEAYKATSISSIKMDIALGLSATKQSSEIALLLESMKNTTVRPQDIPLWFIWLMRSPYARTQTWQWMQFNWDWIVKTFAGDKYYDSFPRNAASGLMTRQELEEYRTFFTPHLSEPALARVIELGINDIEGRVTLLETQGDEVRQALAKFKK